MGHEPDKCRDIFVPWLRSEGAVVTVSDTLESYVKLDQKNEVDLIIQAWTMGQIEGEQEKALLEAVSSGTGIAGWHGGLCDSFRNNTEYQFMTGGQWVAHPGNDGVEYGVRITSDDPLVAGVGDFTVKTDVVQTFFFSHLFTCI